MHEPGDWFTLMDVSVLHFEHVGKSGGALETRATLILRTNDNKIS